MKFLFPSLLFLIAPILPLVFAQAATDPFAIVTPQDKSFVESGTVSVVLSAPKNNLKEVRVAVNDNVYTFTKSMDMGYVCYDGINLDKGMNRIRITLLKGGEAVAEKTIDVFFRSDLSAKSAQAPAGFKRYVYHSPEHENRCAYCHPMSFSRDDKNPSPLEKSGCFTCHKKMISARFAHPPAADWACLNCHNRKPARGGGSALAADDKSCAACHMYSLATWNKKAFRHGPSDGGRCTACHNPHASDHPSLLHANATDVCLVCHEEFLTKPHVIAGGSGNGGHPIRKSPDPYRPGRDFTCASCHNPHAGDAPNFLNNYKASMSIHRFCLSCHKL